MFLQGQNKNAPDSWMMVDDTIKSFISLYPKRWKGFCNFMEEWRRTRYNDVAASKGKGLSKGGFTYGETQHLAKFPSDPQGNNILLTIEKIMPDIYTNERKLNELLRRWPQFAAGNKR